MADDAALRGDFGLYVHWPFCEAKCPYCDFNSHVAAAVDHAAWRTALLSDLRAQAERVSGRLLRSIFFGGGTPSRMHPDTVAALIDEARRLWPCINDLEITLEANPTSIEAGRFRAFADAGVNRVSMGMQALDDADLRRLGRTHDVAQALAAWEVARSHFPRASFDVIYARQDQTPDAWRAELRRILDLGPTHVSLYQLTVEPGTVFARRHAVGKLPGLPDDDRQADMYLETKDILASAGLPAYEISNHAAPGEECRHNLLYWRAGEWLGVGPGAHGRLGGGATRRATVAHRDPDRWRAAVATGGGGLASDDRLDPWDHAEEYLCTAFRLAEGLDLDRAEALGLRIPRPTDLIEEGLLIEEGRRLKPTARGMALSDSIVRYALYRSARVSRSQMVSS